MFCWYFTNKIAFVTYCQHSLHLRYDTIKLYLSGVRFHYIKCNNIDIFHRNLQLPYILRAVKKTQSNVTRALRLPITFSILQELCTCLTTGVFSPLMDLMYTCIFQLAFYGFLRCGEFTVNNRNSKYLILEDISYNADASLCYLNLPTSKTDTYDEGVTIPITNPFPLFPVTTIKKYISTRRSMGAAPSSPLFINSDVDGNPLTRSTFITNLKEVLSRTGYEDRHFSGHSFRIGACTSGAAAGIEDHMLQVLGRWKSGCYTRYIRTQLPSISNAHAQMSHSTALL